MKNWKKIDQTVFNSALAFLTQNNKISEEFIEKQMIAHSKDPKSLSDLFYRILESAQNKQMSSRVIGESIGGIIALNKVLWNFNVNEVCEKFPIGSEDILLENIIQELNPKGKIRRESNSLWPQFCKTIVTAAQFISKFNDITDFKNWVQSFDQDIRSRASLPLLISVEITGIGFPLACDFLKELGYQNFGKPDVHVKYIFNQLNLVDSYNSNNDYQVFNALTRMSLHVNKSSFEIDKIFWLIGSGKFSQDGKVFFPLKGNSTSRRKEFVEYVKKNMN